MFFKKEEFIMHGPGGAGGPGGHGGPGHGGFGGHGFGFGFGAHRGAPFGFPGRSTPGHPADDDDNPYADLPFYQPGIKEKEDDQK